MTQPQVLTAISAPLCPLCGGPNACGPAATGSFNEPCWCQTVQFTPELLAQVPESQRRTACICRACAERGGSLPPSSARS